MHRSLLLTLIVTAVLMAGYSGTTARDRPTAGTSSSALASTKTEDPCAVAGELTSARRPQDALDLITEVRAGTPQTTEVSKPDCDEQRLAALAALGQEQLSSPRETETGVQRAAEDWKDIHKRWLKPFAAFVPTFLTLTAGVLVLARLITSWWNPRRRRSGRWGRRVLITGALLSWVASLALLWTPSLVTGGRWGARDVEWSLVLAAALALLSAFLLGRWLAGRLRLHVDVGGYGAPEADQAAAGRLVALLNELGAEPPRGLEVPRGTDVEALSGVVIGIPGASAPITAVLSLLRVLSASSPWHVAVDKINEDVLSVIITRNGRSVSSAVVDRATLPAPLSGDKSVPVDLAKFAAAAVLTTLAEHHSGFEGLCGARDWRSVGYHYVATTDLAQDERDIPLLAAACATDPGNFLAQFTLRHELCRNVYERKDVHVLQDYIDWLRAQLGNGATSSDDLQGWESVRLRLRYSLAVCAINSVFIHDPRGHKLDDIAVSAVKALHDDLGAIKKKTAFILKMKSCTAALNSLVALHNQQSTREADVRRSRVRHGLATALQWLAERVGEQDPSPVGPHQHHGPWTELPRGPQADYQWACVSTTLKDYDGALKDLRHARHLPQLAMWMALDPQLQPLRDERPRDFPVQPSTNRRGPSWPWRRLP